MSIWLVLICVALLITATYVTALNTSLMTFSRSALVQRCEARGRDRGGQWLLEHLDEAIVSISLVRIILRAAFLIVVVGLVINLGAEPAPIGWPQLIGAGLLAAVISWLFNAVIGAAVARHAAVGLVVAALPLLRVVTICLSPLAGTLRFIDEAVRRLTGANLREDEAEAELLRSIEDTQRQGGLDDASVTMLENVVEFSSTDVSEIMTPRTEIEGIAVTDDLVAIRAFIEKAGHSRIPVFEENLDNILGILYTKDLIPYIGEDAADFHLQPLLRQPIVIPETKPVSELLADFQQSEVHMAIVIDEYGGTAGLVTIEDVLEEIVGEIHDEHEPEDEAPPTLTAIDERYAEVDGRYHIDDLNEALNLDLPEDGDFDTVGGFMMTRLGRVPAEGEMVEAHGSRFTTLQATQTHVQKIGIERLSEEELEQSESQDAATGNSNGDRSRRPGNGNGNGGPPSGDRSRSDAAQADTP